MVYYSISEDEIFMNGWIDACFFGLIGDQINWVDIIILGRL